MADDPFLTTQQVADEFGIPVSSLLKGRERGNGPAFHKLGTKHNSPIRYRKSAVEAWLDERKFKSIAETLAQK